MFSLLDLSFVLCSRALFTCSRHMLYSRALLTLRTYHVRKSDLTE